MDKIMIRENLKLLIIIPIMLFIAAGITWLFFETGKINFITVFIGVLNTLVVFLALILNLLDSWRWRWVK